MAHHSNDKYDEASRIEEGNGHRPFTAVTLTPQQFESLYLAPKDAQPSRSVAATFGNPVGLGTFALMLEVLPYSLALCELGGTNTVSILAIAPAAIFVGFVMLISAGIMCWIMGITFPSLVFFTYGTFSGLLWYLNNPVSNILVTQGGLLSGGTAQGIAAFGLAAESIEFNHGLSFVLIPFAIASGIFTIASLKTDVVNFILFTCLTCFFGLESANYYHAGSGNLALAHKEQVAGGGFGIAASLCAIYLSIHLALAAVNFPFNIPVFDLSNFLVRKQAKNE